jgi:antitoxin MazE
MQVSVIPIGNSKGIRLSKTILEKYNINDSVELLLEKEYIIIKPLIEPRKNWEKAFEKMYESGDDQALITDVFEDETFEEWT